MKKKAIQYVLIIVVLGIWGMIGLRFFNFFAGEEQNEMISEAPREAFSLAKSQQSYEIKGNYPDPFLKGSKTEFHSAKKNASSHAGNPNLHTHNNQKEKQKTVKPVPANDFPAIQLAGIISNKQNGKKSAIMVQDGKEYSLTQGETVNGIKLAKIFSDSVLVTYQKKNKMIRL